MPDFVATKPPDYQPPPGAVGDDALAGDKPFILHPDGLGWIWVPTGLNDGPLPAHYEPLESPVRNRDVSGGAESIRCRRRRGASGNEYATSPDATYPYILTTYRLTEHHTAGGMSRTLSHLAELQPEMFCEISTELAQRIVDRAGRVDHGVDGARRDRGACVGDAADADADDRWEADAASGAAISLGIFGIGEGRHRQRSGGDFGRAERADHGDEGNLVRRERAGARMRNGESSTLHTSKGGLEQASN